MLKIYEFYNVPDSNLVVAEDISEASTIIKNTLSSAYEKSEPIIEKFDGYYSVKIYNDIYTYYLHYDVYEFEIKKGFLS